MKVICGGKEAGLVRDVELQCNSDRVSRNLQGFLEQELSIRVILNLVKLAGTQYSQLDQSLIVGYPGKGMT